MQFWRSHTNGLWLVTTSILYTDPVKQTHCLFACIFRYSDPDMSASNPPRGAACCRNQPSRYFPATGSDGVFEMHRQWLIVLLAGLFPSARGFSSVPGQGCCFELVEGSTGSSAWTRSYCYGQHAGGWDPYSISEAGCLRNAGVFRDCSQVCAPPLHPRPRGLRHPAPALSTAPASTTP